MKKEFQHIIHLLGLFIGITFFLSVNIAKPSFSKYVKSSKGNLEFTVKKTDSPHSTPCKETSPEENASPSEKEKEQELDGFDIHLVNSSDVLSHSILFISKSLPEQTVQYSSHSSSLFIWHCAFLI